MARSMLLLTLCLFWGLADKVHGQNRYGGKSPLPVFTKVETEVINENSTSISVRYKASERPDYQWFIDDVPFAGGTGDYFVHNYYDGWLCLTRIIVPNSLGTRFSVCLQIPDARNCLRFRTVSGIQEEDVDFPWPLIVPAPRARYNSGQNVRIFAPELENQEYTYSGRFIFHKPRETDQPLRVAEINGMEGGQENDVVTMTPVTSGSPGWLIEVATGTTNYEGVLLLQTTIEPTQPTSVVEQSVSTRPLNIYDRQHPAPFPENFVAMLPHRGNMLSVTCRSQSDLFCLITCPFAVNGDLLYTQLSLSHLQGEGATVVHLPRTSLFALAKRTGKYLAEARFQLNVSEDAEPGIYQCSVTLAGTTTHTLVSLTLV